MNFKEQIKDDIKNVFLKSSEFAELHRIDDIENISIIIDDDRLKEQTLKAAGTYVGDVLFYIAVEDLPAKPVIGQIMKLDNKIHRVMNVGEEDGMFIITLGKNRS